MILTSKFCVILINTSPPPRTRVRLMLSQRRRNAALSASQDAHPLADYKNFDIAALADI